MGEGNRKKLQFFNDHPLCCYCGGLRFATTIDHQPGRLFFSNRQWPKGFEFPACDECNKATQDSEQLARLVLTPGEMDDWNHARWLSTVRYVKKANPGVISQMIPSRRDVRAALKEIGAEVPRGFTLGDVPMIKLESQFWRDHLENIGRKIALSLHYQRFLSPLSDDGVGWIIFQTNASDPKPLTEVFSELADQRVLPVAQGRQVWDQFSVRWGAAADAKVGAWAFHLHMRLFYYVVTVDDKDWASRLNPDFMGRKFKNFRYPIELGS